MSEPKNKDNQDKNRKAKSFGPYALFLFVLIAIMIMVGGRDALKNEVELTIDEFEYELHTGQIDSLKLVGANEIRGQYKGRKETFLVKHPGFGDGQRMEEYQQLAAIGTYRTISAPQFAEAVQKGYLKPTNARHLTAVETREGALPAPAKGEAAPGGAEGGSLETAASTELAQIDRYLVRALAKPRSEWANGEKLPDWVPNTSGEVWFEVRDVRDAQALLGSLQTGGVPVVAQRFNIEPKKGTSYESPDSLFANFLIFWGPWLLILIVFFFFLRQMRNQAGSGGVMSFGRSRAQLYTKENHTNTTFDDVAGCTEAKDEVKEVVEFLKNPGRFTRLGGRIPRGILLVGPPGCGKTLLAKAIAGEADVPFFSISGSDFVEMFVGVGASRVRDLFKQAHDNSPCIIFLDEIDAVGRRRGSGMGGGHDEREQTLNAILVEMDGFGTDEGIIVIAATNRPDVLDPALLRPGRFDREVVIDLPDLAGREEILRVHLKKVKAAADVDAAVLARSTPGYSGADLAAIANEAAIMAALAKKDEITMEHLEEARDKVRYGRQKRSKSIEEEDRRVTAYHEAGHAIVAAMIPEVDPPHKVTIVPRGRALGTTMMLPDKESYHFQRKKMLGQLAVAFGGRVAEAQFVGDISAGASDDIRRATELARAMVTELGMSDKIGPIHYAERQGSDFLGTELTSGKWHSEETAREIDEEIERILKEAYETAVRIVRDNTEQMERITQALLTWETISGVEIKRILAGESLENLRPTPPPQRPSAPAATTPAAGASPRTQAGELPGTPGLSPA